MMRVLTSLLILVLAAISAAHAAVPQVIKVQGFLTDPSGVPVDTTVGMTFALYDAATDGNLIRQLGPLAIQVRSGVYEATLDFIAADFSAPDRHLQITVNGEVLSPRLRIGSAPYAYQAEGPAGPPGPTGPAGPAGPQGPAGPPGPTDPALRAAVCQLFGNDPLPAAVCGSCFVASHCSDSNTCTTDLCNDPGTPSASCANPPVPTGTPCAGGVCSAGQCVLCTQNGQCDDGNPCTVDTCLNPGAANASCANTVQADLSVCSDGQGYCQSGTCVKLVFVTSTTHTGNLGGIAGADAICNQRAAEAGIGGTYRAWLSDSMGSPASRFARSTIPYQRLDTARVANDYTDLTDGMINVPINRTETGNAIGSVNVWTSTMSSGMQSGGAFCADWSSSAGGNSANVYGVSSQTNSQWTQTSGTRSCNMLLHLYCFQQ